jgi:hypothetical protein
MKITNSGWSINRAERIVVSNPAVSRRSVILATVARAVASQDPERAKTLVDQAEQLANTLRTGARNRMLRDVAAVVVDYDPDRTVRIATTITNRYLRFLVLVEAAEAVASHDPGRATMLADQAEQLAASLHMRGRSWRLTKIARAVASHNPARAKTLTDQAEQLAVTITNENKRNAALADIASNIAHYDPDRAERLANAITQPWSRTETISLIIRSIAAYDPDRAVQLASTLRGDPNIIHGSNFACFIAGMQTDQHRRSHLRQYC